MSPRTADAGNPSRLYLDVLEEFERGLEPNPALDLNLKDFTGRMWNEVEAQTEMRWNWHLDELCELLHRVSAGEIQRLLINIPPGTMKALDIDTPMLTTWGWKAHGDLAPGDFVYAPDGRPRRVLACTDHIEEPVRRLTFDDGAEIVAGDGHRWEVLRDHGETPRRRRRETVTTADIKTGSHSDAIPVAEPLKTAPQRLLIDPYVLGAWLGDGGSNAGSIYVADQDIDSPLGTLGEIRHTTKADGPYKQDFHRLLIPGLQTKLRVLGLLNNKHIPDDYMEASLIQRWSLLQGLMDTDAGCTTRGSCYFTTANEAMARRFTELVASLGMKAHRRSRYTTLNGNRYGPHYRVTFTPWPGQIVFRVERKQERATGTEDLRKRRRYIKTVEPEGRMAVNCIQVEGGMYLAGRDFVATHNSLLVSVFWPAWEWARAPHLRIFTASYTTRLTIRDNLRLRNIVTSDWYRTNFSLRLMGDQNEKIQFNTSEGGWRMASSIGGMATGEHPDRIIIDDPHSADQARSDIERQRALDWYDRTLSTRGISRDVRVVCIMQRLHEKDLSAHLLQKGSWHHVCYPMRYESEHPDDELWEPDPTDHRSEDGELLWPALFPAAVVDKLEFDLTPYGAAGQLQQRPGPEGGGLFKRAWFKFCDAPLLGDDVTRIRAWDTAATEEGGDWTVGVRMAMQGDNFVIEDVIRVQMEPGDVDDLIVATAELDGKSCGVREEEEGGASGKAVTAARAKRLKKYDYAGVSISGNKVVRAKPLRTQANAGHVWLVKAPWNEAFLQEISSFPVGDHDDQVDGSSCAYNSLVGDEKPVSGKVVLW